MQKKKKKLKQDNANITQKNIKLVRDKELDESQPRGNVLLYITLICRYNNNNNVGLYITILYYYIKILYYTIYFILLFSVCVLFLDWLFST